MMFARGLPWALLALLLLAVGAIRWGLLGLPLERDEGEYAYMGQLMLQGIPPYAEAYNMKFPGTYAAYAATMALFGQTGSGIHLGLLAVNALTTVIVFGLGRRLYGAAGGVAAAAAFAFLAVSTGVLGVVAHATHYQMLAVMLGFLLLERALAAGRGPGLVLAGAALGLGILVKQPGAAFVPVALAIAAWPGRAHKARNAALVLAGVALPLVLTGLLLWRAGVFATFWFWCVDYARAYAGITSWHEKWVRFSWMWPTLFRPWGGVFALSLLGLALALRRNVDPYMRATLVGVPLAGLAAAAAGGWFRPHYFVTLLPGAALLAGYAVAALPRLKPAAVAVLALGIAVGLRQDAGTLFQPSMTQASRQLYPFEVAFAEAEQVGQYLRRVAAPADRVFVYGSEPQILFYAARRSATGYLYMLPLGEQQAYARDMGRQMMAEVDANKPAYVVAVQASNGFYPSPNMVPIRDWLQQLLNGYTLAGYVLLGPGAVGHFVEVKPGAEAPGMHGLFVFRRD